MLSEQQQDEYRKALRVTRQLGPYVLQRQDRHTGEWFNVGKSVVGIEEAHRLLNSVKAAERGNSKMRVVPQIVADSLREGVKLGKRIGRAEALIEAARNARALAGG